jgi:hypothetical protein
VIAAAIAAAACSPSAATPAPAAPTAAATSPAGQQGTPPDFAKIQQCLEAAGVALPSGGFGPLPSGFAPPSGGFGPLPSGVVPPSGGFGPLPSGGFPGGALDPAIAVALKACGITFPGMPSNP